jgi:microcystin-dependent protein
MSDTLLGEIKMFAGNFAPPGWAFCHGQLMPIAQNQELFEIIGNTYGGDGRNTFGLPDLRGRIPMGTGAGPGLTNRNLGEGGGTENVVLNEADLPAHDHPLRASNSAANQTSPSGNVLARAAGNTYLGAGTNVVMGADSIGTAGSNSPHTNIQPFRALSFIIAVQGRNPRDEVRILRGVSD